MSVILGDWQLGGGVLPVLSVRHWEEEGVAPNFVEIPWSLRDASSAISMT